MPESVPQRLSRGLSAPTFAALALGPGDRADHGDVRRARASASVGFHDEAAGRARAERILAESSAAERDVVDVETGLRGYLLTGEERFLEPYEAGRLHYDGHFVTMAALVHDPRQARAPARSCAAPPTRTSTATPCRCARSGAACRADALAAATADGKRRLDALRDRFDAFNRAEDAARGRPQRARRVARRTGRS